MAATILRTIEEHQAAQPLVNGLNAYLLLGLDVHLAVAVFNGRLGEALLDISLCLFYKRIKLLPSEYGLNFFSLDGQFYYYVVCHFGGKFSAFHWARFAAALHRLLHKLIRVWHGGWIYVDDWLWRLLAMTSVPVVVLGWAEHEALKHLAFGLEICAS